MSIVVLVSGSGTNLQAIINAIAENKLVASIKAVICNKINVGAIDIAKTAGIPVIIRTWDRKNISRSVYDMTIAHDIVNLQCDLVVLAGWMHILSELCLGWIKCPIINLHPALPETFKGADAVKMAWDAFEKGEITKTGVMVHHVIPEIDSGAVIDTAEIDISNDYTLSILREKIKMIEKPVLINAIKIILNSPKLLSQGKVRDVYNIGGGILQMVATDRCSAFDRAICDIPNKGFYLNKMSEWWFEKTRHIVPNHCVSTDESSMFVKECVPFGVEVVVRGYMTGSTKTSLWTHYRNALTEGIHYCGHYIPPGLKQNQKLPENIVTPTTKGEIDIPVSAKEIIDMGLATPEQWKYIHDKALELFNFGQAIAQKMGLILVDTKYEFGLDHNDQILLIDELHTCDSSRYWLADTHEKLDKDAIRDWLQSKCDPYSVESLPQVPDDVINRVSTIYKEMAERFCGDIDIPLYKTDISAIAHRYY